MNLKNLKNLLPETFSQWLFIVCLLTLTVTNAVVTWQEVITVSNYKKIVPYNNIEYKFTNLREIIQGQEFIGYYSDDTQLKDENNAKAYSHAQFALAPTVVELNNLNHKYILLVCSNEKLALEKMVEIGAVPLRRNKFGMMLVERENP